MPTGAPRSVGYNREAVDYRDRITFDPNRMAGKACVRDLGFTVQDVLDYAATAANEADVIARFPGLTPEDIHACVAFASDRISGVDNATRPNIHSRERKLAGA
jgi:uncharacterized protein (DUF433 family)